jgi:hypothetical protein
MGEGDVPLVDVVIIRTANIKLYAEGLTEASTKAEIN